MGAEYAPDCHPDPCLDCIYTLEGEKMNADKFIIGLLTLTMLLSFGAYQYERARPAEVVEVVRYERVLVNEVSIPMTYNAEELNNYCASEYATLKVKGWLPNV